MSTVAVALCRPGFEVEAAADLAGIATRARTVSTAEVRRDSGFVVARLDATAGPEAWRRAVAGAPPVFIRSHWIGTGPHPIAAPRPATAADEPRARAGGGVDRITPLVGAFEALASTAGHEPAWQAPFVEHADTNDGRALSTLARALEGRLAGALAARGYASATSARRAHVLLVDGATAYVGTADDPWGSRWPNGIARVRAPAGAPSRSALKLAEAIALFLGERAGTLLREGLSAVDLGAAPGGWTSQLVARGMHVTAVDNAALDPALARHPNVEHVRADGLGYRPRRPVDWLVCDMVERPARIAALVGDWIAEGRARHAIFNLKLPMKRRRDEALACAAAIRARIEQAGIEASVALRHLYHDREEVTGCVLRER